MKLGWYTVSGGKAHHFAKRKHWLGVAVYDCGLWVADHRYPEPDTPGEHAPRCKRCERRKG